MKNILRELIYLFFPPTCYHCGESLVGNERNLCLKCQMRLPLTNFSNAKNNDTEMRIGGRIPVIAATSLMYYKRESPSQTILHQIKYHGHYRMAHEYGSILGKELADSGRFDDVDVLIPVPLHWLKKWKRGYNQSELLCKGIADSFPKPINTHTLYRKRYTHTQTHKNHFRRMENMIGVFGLRDKKTLEGKHVLLVDDVITSGATTESCWQALKSVPNIKISIASLAIAGGL